MRITKPSSKSKKTKPKSSTMNILSIDDLDQRDLITIISLSPHDMIVELIQNVACGLLAIVIMIQLRISVLKEKPAYMDQLPSYRQYKKNLIQGIPGRTIASLYTVFKTLPVFDEPKPELIGDILLNNINIATPNSKRLKSPTKGNWQEFMNGEMAVVLGKLISCPSNNLNIFGITSAWANAATVDSILSNYRKVLSLFPLFKEMDLTDSITNEEIIQKFRMHFLTNNGGFTDDSAVFAEPNFISSKIEQEILSDKITRNGEINSILTSKGEIPDSPLTENMLFMNLTEFEKVQYSSALRQGLKDYLRVLNNRAKQRISRADKKQTLNNPEETGYTQVPLDTVELIPPVTKAKRGSPRKSPADLGTKNLPG